MGKVYDGIMGLVVGDALGVPFEFKQRDTFKCTGMVGYGTYNQPAGTWSDDSSLTLATVESLAKHKEIIPHDIMKNFCRWFYAHEFTPHGKVFDVGNTTRIAISTYFNTTTPADRCGGEGYMDNGNGSLMRILPLAFVTPKDDDIFTISALTHAHIISMTACVIYITVAINLLHNVPIDKAIKYGCDFTDIVEFDRLDRLKELTRDDIRSTGFVVDTLEAALWCFLNTDSYKDCVLEAVNLGGDTDTIAAVAGGLAGIYYGVGGEKGIPEDWINQIARKKWIKELCDKLEEAR